MLKRKWLIPLVLILALALSACTSGNVPKDNGSANQGEPNTSTSQQGDSSQEGVKLYENVKLTGEEAFNIFKEKYPEANVNELELDSDNGTYYYEVEGYDDTKKYELKINPTDGKIIKEEVDTKKDQTGDITIEDIGKIEGFINKATEDAGNNYKVKEWNLKHEDGNVIFKVEVIDDKNHDIDYKFNVTTEELIKKD